MDRRAEDLACRELVELVTEYLEEALSPEDRARFDRHVEECADCTAHLSQMRRILGLVGRLTEAPVTASARQSLLGAFRAWSEFGPHRA